MKRLWSWILAAVVAAILIAIGVGVGVGVGTRKHNASSQPAASSGAASNGDSKILEDLITKYKLPSLAVGISKAGNFTDKVAGVRKLGDSTPVQLTDQFHLGSNTKAMTATLIGMFIEQSRGFQWNSTLQDALPFLASEMSEGHRNTTVDMLTSHRSGIIDDYRTNTTFAMSLLDPSLSPSQGRLLMIRRILSKAPAAKPGTFTYDNTNYILAGAILEHFSGTNSSWENLITSRLFQPLNMTCGFGTPTESSTTSIDNPWGHVFSIAGDSKAAPTPVGGPLIQRDNPPAVGPAGTVHCPMSSYARFLQLHLDGYHNRTNALNLSAPTFAHLHAPYPDPTAAQPYTYGGWIYINGTNAPWAGGVSLAHSGTNGMHYATAILAPGIGERGVALMALTNAGKPNDDAGGPAGEGTMAAWTEIVRGRLLGGLKG